MTWKELYINYNQDVYNYILLMVGNKETAEDITQETFIKVKSSLHKFRGESHYYTWIISMARNSIYDYWRRKRLITFIPLKTSVPLVNNNSPEKILEDDETVNELYNCIKRLKTSYQEVIILRKVHVLTVQETAEVLGWSVSKVKSTTHRALEALKKEIENFKNEEGS
ncbi:RNA polymerase sigma factor [Evansella sp. AB-rgal1]|uniref:RNA polymerase sigma factor n=1 Tax=Evansella sp. AB-rgal1 TaxID=3242696 RepID=UPI00359CD7FC